jgi:hypothetical protein
MMAYRKLTEDTTCIGIHGTTGEEMDEGGELAAGALVRAVTIFDALLAGEETTVVTFDASTDGGKTWYRQRTYGDLPLD